MYPICLTGQRRDRPELCLHAVKINSIFDLLDLILELLFGELKIKVCAGELDDFLYRLLDCDPVLFDFGLHFLQRLRLL